jgi:putative hydrolase of the HAD superfamily
VRGFFADHGGDVNDQRYAALAAAAGPGYDRAASHARRMAYRERLHESLGPAPGIRDWFEQAAGLGLRLAVASSSPGGWVSRHLHSTGLAAGISVMACGDEVGSHKPDPAVYRLALRRLGLGPERAVAFEDTPHGVAAAQAAGLFCVAIPNAFTAAERVATADLVLRDATEADLETVIHQAGRHGDRPARRPR